MIKPIKYLPTVFKITPKAQALLRKRHDNDLLFLGCSAIQETINSDNNAKKTFLTKIKSMFGPTTRLHVYLDANENKKFVLSTFRRVNQYNLLGKDVVIDLEQIAMSKKMLTRALLESKEGILENLAFLKNLIK